MAMRIGHGYDIHVLVEGRPLVLGGVRIPHERGLAGFSDADVVLHALSDALLGGAGLADIGAHFPPGDPRFRDADSLGLLAQVVEKVRQAGFGIASCDLTVVAEAPSLAPHRDAIRDRVAASLGISPEAVGFKATTNEGLGPVGRREAIAAYAVALLETRGQGPGR